jgi:hypothetical protein
MNMTTEQTTEQTTEGGTEMETEQTTNTVIGDIENQNTVTMTQQAYTAIGEQHSAAQEQLNQRIGELNDALMVAQSNTIEGMVEAQVANLDIYDKVSDCLRDEAHDYIENWADNEFSDRVSNYLNNYISDYLDYYDIANQVENEIDWNDRFHDALQNMCGAGEETVAQLVTRLIQHGDIQLPTAPAAPAAPTGLDQQAIYTALDQIRGGITTILAHMDANPPEVTANENNE